MNFSVSVIYTLFCIALSINAEKPCKTFDGSIGQCIDMRECEVIIKILQGPEPPLFTRDEVIEKVRRLKCGTNEKDQKLCCPRRRTEQKYENESLAGNIGPTDLKISSFGGDEPQAVSAVNNNQAKGQEPQPIKSSGQGVRAISTNGLSNSVQGFRPIDDNKPPNTNVKGSQIAASEPSNDNPSSKTEINLKTSKKLLPEACGKSLQYKYFSGNTTDLDDFPWIALLEYETPQGRRKGCGGVLINDRYVLTAAHCVVRLRAQWRVVNVHLGKYNIHANHDCTEDGDCSEPKVIPVVDRIVHPEYIERDGYRLNDVALLRLDKPVSFTPYIEPICLPSKKPFRQLYLASGWGKTLYNDGHDQKRVSKMKLQNCEVCAERGIRLSENQFCTNSTHAQDACIPDEGGPLMGVEANDDGSHRTTVFGILSYIGRPTDFRCSANNWPALYTSVLEYVPLITKWMKN